MIDELELNRLHASCRKALARYSADSQFDHLMEEVAELILAMHRRWRNRSTDEDILEELVDVFMCTVEMGVHHFGPEAFNSMLRQKNAKFERQVESGNMVKDKPKKMSKPKVTKSKATKAKATKATKTKATKAAKPKSKTKSKGR